MEPEPLATALNESARRPECFIAVYDAHADRLLAYLTRRAFDPEIGLDLTAEVFARAFRSRGRFRGSTDDQVAAWLYAIAKRELARYFRRGQTERRALHRLQMEVPAADEDDLAQIIEQANLGDLRAALSDALAQLSASTRDALRLRVIDGLPYAEVAMRLQVSEPTARARVSRGLRAMAELLDQNPTLEDRTG
jgi:RNA polymerase sigma factor (sigma-70 family)